MEKITNKALAAFKQETARIGEVIRKKEAAMNPSKTLSTDEIINKVRSSLIMAHGQDYAPLHNKNSFALDPKQRWSTASKKITKKHGKIFGNIICSLAMSENYIYAKKIKEFYKNGANELDTLELVAFQIMDSIKR